LSVIEETSGDGGKRVGELDGIWVVEIDGVGVDITHHWIRLSLELERKNKPIIQRLETVFAGKWDGVGCLCR
jgi:hypothetical protein